MRQSGHYRVMYLGDWDIAYFDGTYWYFPGSELEGFDSDFDEIDDNRINPEPEKQIGITITCKTDNITPIRNVDANGNDL